MKMLPLLLTALAALCTSTGRAQQRDTFSVFFPFNEHGLDNASRFKIDSLLYREVLHRGQRVQIIGFADYVGSSGYNDTLSLRRARSVQDYLLQSGFRPGDITLLLAKGEIERTGAQGREGYPADRRVDILLLSSATRMAKPVPAPVPRQAAPAVPPSPVVFRPYTPPAATSDKLDDMTSLPVNSTIVLRHLYFPPGRHVLVASSLPELDTLLDLLEQQPNLCIRIEGHVCCIDSSFLDALDEDEGEYNLSLNRARFIYEYLVHKGIDPKRLQYYGYGKKHPIIAEEHDMDEAEVNRRVEIRILSR